MSNPTSQSWIEVEIRTPEQAKKAVGEILSPFVGPTLKEKPTEDRGIWSIKGILPADVSVDHRLWQLEKGLIQIEQEFGLSNAVLAEIRQVQTDQNPAGHGIEPERVFFGGPFVVASPGKPVATDQDQTVLRVTAGQAFGDGSHGSTRIALQLIGGLFQGHHGSPPEPGWCLDAGCGSGVLALATAALWTGRVLAVDISPEAIRRVKTNQESNPPWSSRIMPVLGDLSCCRGPFGVILANLVPSVHLNACEILWAALGAGGWLVLAGFRETQEDLVARLFVSKGAEEKGRFCEQGWTGLLLRKPKLPNSSYK